MIENRPHLSFHFEHMAISCRISGVRVMKKNEKIVEPLKRVILSITSGSAPDGSDPPGPARTMDFVFGTGSRGLAPFEYELAGMRIGDAKNIAVEHKKAVELFDHLYSLFCAAAPPHSASSLRVEIVDIVDADERELIRAMAGSASCGNDCNCGCGGH
jgi:hypothetical protein